MSQSKTNLQYHVPDTSKIILQEEGVEDVNISKIKFEPYGDLTDQAYSKFNETLINNQ